MGETKENKKVTKGKHKEKPTIGDIIFRVLVVVAIFFICVLFYTFYIRNISEQVNDNNSVIRQIQTYR